MQRRRILGLVLLMIVGFTIISARLVWLQGFQWRDYHLEAERFHRRVWADPAPRGPIVDRFGTELASDEPSHQIVYALSDLEMVRSVCRRVRREILRDRAARKSFPYSREDLWVTLQEVREALRPSFTSTEPLPEHRWLSGIPTTAANRLARAVRLRPESFPGIAVEVDAGEVWIRPGELFAGEVLIRKLEQRLERPPGSLFSRVWKQYERVQNPEISSQRREEIFRYIEHQLVRDVPADLVLEMALEPDRFPGLRIREVPRRRVDAPPGLARLIGRVGARRPIDQERWEEAEEPILDRHRFRTMEPLRLLKERAHHSEDLVGHDGLERRYEDSLRGTSGGTLWIVDHRQNPRGEPLDLEPPVPGRPLTLTLDAEFCEFLGTLTETRDPFGASILVADARTGELLGWESYPSAPAEIFRDQGEYQRVLTEKRGHFFDRPAAYAMDPGSTFKSLVAIAALEDGVLPTGEEIECDGYYNRETPTRLRCRNHAHFLSLDVEEALMRSCNVFFYRVGGDRLGIDRMTQWAERFGLWQLVQPGVGAEVRGIPPRASAQSVAIGRTFTTTPLQLLRMTTMIANRGRDPGLTLVPGSGATPLPDPQVSDATWDTVIRGMDRAAHDPKGTAAKPTYGLSVFDCAVKTGTAGISSANLPEEWRTLPDGEPVEWNRAWLIGFAPAKDPIFSFVIGLERVRGHGGDECAPIAAKILEWLEKERGFTQLRLEEER